LTPSPTTFLSDEMARCMNLQTARAVAKRLRFECPPTPLRHLEGRGPFPPTPFADRRCGSVKRTMEVDNGMLPEQSEFKRRA